jgi:beta-lactam-binding protein with PASTA domain/predicted Ser/Thr protein kinase
MAELASGTLIDGRYRVISRLGSGGMADVFLAEDEQLGRKVALKLLHRRFSEDEGFVERFRREAQAAAGLQHPNIVGVYDRGAYDGTYYIAMEYLPGRSLKQLIRQEAPVDPLRAIEITIQILKAARFAHRHGVIHRDLKPHNVIIDDSGHVKVTDFGIARAGASDMTETGSIMGTAQYLSPEQAQGHAVSAGSDLYSVGVLLYELLTGRVPFDAEAAVTIALKHVSEAPLAPTQVNPRVPPELEHVVMWALNKNPADRPASADDFIRALEAARASIQAGSPTERTASMAALAVAPVAGGAGVAVAGVPPVPPPAVGYGPGAEDAAWDPLAGPPPPPYEPDRGRSAWLWVALLVIVLALGAGAAAYFLTREKLVTVPNVIPDQLSTARTVLENRGFLVSVTPQQSTKPVGVVIGEIPNAGSRAPKGSTVSLAVSAGPGTETVPPVEGESLKQARADIRAAHLTVGRIVRQTSSQYPAGQVIGTDPAAGQMPPAGSRVTVFVSSGPAKVAVPDVTTESEAQAKSDLHNAGFQVTVAKQNTSDPTQVGKVINQTPAGGTQLTPGSSVTIVVGQAQTTATVPRVRGDTAAQATQALQAAGFSVRQTSQTVSDPTQNGVVLHESPRAGSTAKKGSTVTIVVGQYTSTTSTTPTTTTSTTPTTTTTAP